MDVFWYFFSKVRLAYQHIEERKKRGMTNEHAANATAIELVQCAESHCRAFLVSSAFEMTKDINKKLSPELSKVIHQLIELYAIDTCMKCPGDLLRVCSFHDERFLFLFTFIRACVFFLCFSYVVYNNNGKGSPASTRKIGKCPRTNSTECSWHCRWLWYSGRYSVFGIRYFNWNIFDFFQVPLSHIHHRFIHFHFNLCFHSSPAVGAYDGNVYERLYAEAQKSPLNKANDNKAFHLYLKPFLKSNL